MERLTRAQVREVDRRAIEELGLLGIVLMENAARSLFDAATAMLGGNARGRTRGRSSAAAGTTAATGTPSPGTCTTRATVVTIHAAKPIADLDGDAATNARVAAAIRPGDRLGRPGTRCGRPTPTCSSTRCSAPD